MHAKKNDRLIVKGHTVGAHDRIGLILEAQGEDDGPPFLVEWSDAPGQHLIWPGPDAFVESHHADGAPSSDASHT
jgi:hypothetical protein